MIGHVCVTDRCTPSFMELERIGFFFLVFLLKNPNFLCSRGDVTGETCGDDLGDPPLLFSSGLLSLPGGVRETKSCHPTQGSSSFLEKRVVLGVVELSAFTLLITS